MSEHHPSPAAPHRTPVDAAEAAFLARLADQIAPAGDAAPRLVGEGSNNWVYRLEGADGALALKLGKPHREVFAASEPAKELWCAGAARAAGVPTPAILAVGVFEGRPYQLQAFASGRAAVDDDRAAAWAAMGRWARLIHAIPISGWGDRLIANGVFGDDWDRHLAYNIAALTDNDPLIGLGVLDARGSDDLKRRFQRLAQAPLTIGLCHGDLAMHNLLVDEAVETEGLVLLDWGCAFAGPVPHYELNEIIRAGAASDGELELFRGAYGLSDAAYVAVAADLPDLLVLRDIDTLRWGLEHRPGEVDALARRARRSLDRLS